MEKTDGNSCYFSIVTLLILDFINGKIISSVSLISLRIISLITLGHGLQGWKC